jgi:hypothetical protein
MAEIRPFSSKNVLLRRDIVGKLKDPIDRLPDSSFSYGRPLIKDPEGAGSGITTLHGLIVVMSEWKFHIQSQARRPGRDFKELNRQSIKNGFTTAKVILNNE